MEVDERPASEHLEGDVDPGSEYDSDSSSQEGTERGQQDMRHTLSVVEPRGKYSNSCGYCKSGFKSSVSYGLMARQLRCEDYQELVDRGWRRSGNFLYKPIMHETCCPQYTIRLDSSKFIPTKEQKQVLKRMQRYLNSTMDTSRDGGSGSGGGSGGGGGGGGGSGKSNAGAGPIVTGVPAGTVQGGRGRKDSSGRGSDGASDAVAAMLMRATVRAAMEAQQSGALQLPQDSAFNLLESSQVRPVTSRSKSRGRQQQVTQGSDTSAAPAPAAGAPGSGSAVATAATAAASHLSLSSTLAIKLAAAWRREAAATSTSTRAEASDMAGELQTTSPPAPTVASPQQIAAAISSAMTQHSMLPRGVTVSAAANGFLNFACDAAAVAAAAAAASQQHVNGDATAAGAADAWYARSASAVGTSQHDDATSLGGLSTSEASLPQAQQHGQPRHGEVRQGSGLQRGSSEGMSHSAMSSLPPLVGAGPHQLSITTVPAAFTEEVYELYRQYQVAVHGDKPNECTPKQFKRFLVDGPLVHDSRLDRHDTAVQAQGDDSDANANASAGTEYDEASVPCGSYHQLYRINGRLIAVSVVDILPRCLSSVYCFYDPAYRALSLGKLTALKEIEWVQAASAVRPNFQYYYLGYYIHSCEKMRYKGNYNPSDLLCPERREWVPLALCKPLLDRQSYGRLSDLLPSHHHDANQRQPSQQDANKHQAKANRKGPVSRARQVLQEPVPADAVSSVPLLIGLPMPITVDALTPLSQQQLQGLLTEYVTMVGPALAPRMLVKLQD